MNPASLYALLQPVRKRMWQSLGLRYGAASFLAGLAIACVWMGIGRFFPIPAYRLAAFMFIAAALLAGAFFAFLRRPDRLAAAKLMDRCGLEDRMATALSHMDDGSVFAVLQREEAFEEGSRFIREDLHQAVPIRLERKNWMPAAGLMAIFSFMLLIPNPMDARLADRQKDRDWVEQQKEQIHELAREAEQMPSPLPQSLQLAEALKDLERKLGQNLTSLEALEELERTMKQMDTNLGELEKQQLKSEQWADSWQRTEALRGLGEALKQASADALRREMASLEERVATMTPQQKEQLANELERLAASAAAPTEAAKQQLREQLQTAAGALRGGGDAQAALAALEAGLAAASAEQLALAQQQALAGQAAAALAAGALPQAQSLGAGGAWAPGGLAEQLAAAGTAGAQPGAASGGTAAAGGSGASGATAGANPAEGGSGTGAGAAGSGTGGSGSTGGAGGIGTGGGAGSGAGGTKGGFGAGSRGLVSTPRERSGSGGTYVDGGPLNGAGGEVSQGGQAPALDGASRPYEDVYADYAAEASSSLGRTELPQNMQNLVRDYFLDIQPQR